MADDVGLIDNDRWHGDLLQRVKDDQTHICKSKKREEGASLFFSSTSISWRRWSTEPEKSMEMSPSMRNCSFARERSQGIDSIDWTISWWKNLLDFSQRYDYQGKSRSSSFGFLLLLTRHSPLVFSHPSDTYIVGHRLWTRDLHGYDFSYPNPTREFVDPPYPTRVFQSSTLTLP